MHRDTKKEAYSDCCRGEPLKQKERHIVAWSPEEDDMLREQIQINGTDNWTMIASKFKDKTTRQCSRRWFTYLNSDFKKGGWSPEEDMLLCEAQKIFGNRWTEIAKVVSGRTDNAVKNRFSTLCKKKAKQHKILAKENSPSCINPLNKGWEKENNSSCINVNNKRAMSCDELHTIGILESAMPVKDTRSNHITEITDARNLGRGLLGGCRTTDEQKRPPLVALARNFQSVSTLPKEHHANTGEVSNDGTFLKEGDPKVVALIQQAEFLTSLALKVNMDNTDRSFENAWKVLQDFLNRSCKSDVLQFQKFDMNFQCECSKNLVEDKGSSSEGSRESWRKHVSPASSEYSTGSTVLSYARGGKTEQIQTRFSKDELQQGQIVQTDCLGDVECIAAYGPAESQADALPACEELKSSGVEDSFLARTKFNSPLQIAPLFRSLAAGIPSPQFSESERRFLLKMLGMELTSPNAAAKPSRSPSCKRALLHSL